MKARFLLGVGFLLAAASAQAQRATDDTSSGWMPGHPAPNPEYIWNTGFFAQSDANFHIGGYGAVQGHFRVGVGMPLGNLTVHGQHEARVVATTSTLSSDETVDFMAMSKEWGTDLGGLRMQRNIVGDVDTSIYAAPAYNGAVERMRVNGDGRVAIGTAPGTAQLMVQRTSPLVDAAITARSDLYGLLAFSSSGASPNGGAAVAAINSNGGNALVVWGKTVLPDASTLQMMPVGGGSVPLCLTGSSLVGLCASSLRYKENVETYSGGLARVLQLRPVTFDWKEDGAPDVGLIAEEAAEVEPLLAQLGPDGTIEGVKNGSLGAVLVAAIQELRAQVETQRVEIERLKARVAQDGAR